MIDNIKRLVNEHHTLMVVIIGVLVICFLYWWFCCKDRPSTNKVKGGGVSYERAFYVKNCNYKSIFVTISSLEYPFFVLNDLGEKELLKNADFFKQFQAFFDDFSTNDCILKTMLKGPSYFLSDDWKRMKRFFKLGPKMFGQIKNGEFKSTIMNGSNFNISAYLKNINGFGEAYIELVNVFNDIGNVSSVSLIGQLAVKPTSTQGEIHHGLECSLNEKNQLNGNVYEICKKYVREWYSDNIKNQFKKFCTDLDGNISVSFDRKPKKIDFWG